MTTSAPDILRRARAKVERGWGQHALWQGNGACAGGALIYAISGETKGAVQAVDAFREVIGGGSIIGWNDEPGRTQADVLRAYDAAIELAESRG